MFLRLFTVFIVSYVFCIVKGHQEKPVEEKILANNTRLCYTYDNLSRVIEKIVKNNDGSVISTETFDYDAAGNIIGDTSETIFEYDTNNRLEMYNGFEVTYDMDGNMVSNSESVFDYDSSNRLVRMDGHFYTYNAEDVRIKCVCDDKETTYTYNTNCKLSQLLTKTTNGVVTKYVYGLGLIGEEASNTFRTYHFDFRGSTVAVTDASGTVTDTFAYDTYGNCIARTGTSDIIFGYNGRDGVVTDTNGLCYMRARYYSPDMRRFINADIIAGKISNAVTLNRYAYANGNPVSNVDPFGLSPDTKESFNLETLFDILKKIKSKYDTGFASKMLAETLDQLLSFKNVFTVSNKLSVNIPLGLNDTLTYSTAVKRGRGNIEVSAVVEKQLELAESFSFPMGDNGSISIGNDGSVTIEYFADIDEYTTIAASISASPNASITAGYTVTTTDKYTNTVSTSIELTHNAKRQDPPVKQPEPTPVPVPVPISPPSSKPDDVYVRDDFGRKALNVAKGAATVAGILLIGYALANDATFVGIIDDFIFLPLGSFLMRLGA